MTYDIEKVAQLIGAEPTGCREGSIKFLLTDSRSLCFAEDTLFFALKTKRGDGHRYLAELYRRGVRAFCVEQLPDDMDNYPEACFLKTDSTRKALQQLAKAHRQAFQLPVVGITGSNGKTTVKEWLYQLLAPERNITRSPRSYNSQIGVPLSVWLIDEDAQLGIFEAGISQPGEMTAIADIIKPTIAILTNIGSAHQENFRGKDELLKEKNVLLECAETTVCSAEDLKEIERLHPADSIKTRLTWSTVDTAATLYVENIEKHQEQTTIVYRYKGSCGVLTLPFIDEASIRNAIICALSCLHLGMDADTLSKRIAKLEPVAMRLEVIEGRNGCTLINDSYNSDINSLNIALDFMCRRTNPDNCRHTLILSDIKQTGMTAETLYDEVASLCLKRGVDCLIGIGEDISASHALTCLPETHFFRNVYEFTQSHIAERLRNEIILIKGARQFEFDQLTELLSDKVHETTLEVNLKAVVDNMNHYKAMMKPGVKLVFMIKANGYGAGAVEIAKTLQNYHADYLAVAVADEGATLRKNGITSNIIVMNPEMSAMRTIFYHSLEPEIYSFRLLEAFIKAAEKEGITNYPVHIKIDTGMHRLGFDPYNDMERLIDRLKRQDAVKPRSVFSHFVGADSGLFDDFSQSQFSKFTQASDKLQSAYEHHILRHIDNSAGIERFEERQMDMCRLGIGLYGIDPIDNAIINTVSTLKTTILQIRNVKKGDSIGYSRRTTTERDSRIAAIPIGYADGLNRRLGNRKGFCLVNGKRAYYMGNICMDVAMIDVTDIDCKEGDPVEIFGDHLPVTVLSDLLDTIPYEVLTAVSDRVKRVYFRE